MQFHTNGKDNFTLTGKTSLTLIYLSLSSLQIVFKQSTLDCHVSSAMQPCLLNGVQFSCKKRKKRKKKKKK